MTTNFDGRSFKNPAESRIKSPFEGASDRRQKAIGGVMARRYARRARRENRAI